MNIRSLVAAAVLVGWAPAAIAQEASAFVGTWVGSSPTLIAKAGELELGGRERSITLEIVQGTLVRGSKTWRATDEVAGDIGEDVPVLEGNELLIGVVGVDGTLRLVETSGDGGMFFGRLVDDTTLVMDYLETGGEILAVSTTRLTRQGE